MSEHRGFTLLELMAVVAIIAILAAIALPAFSNYSVRAQITEGLTLASDVQKAVEDFYAARGRFPTHNGSMGTSLATSHVGRFVTEIGVMSGGGPVGSEIGIRFGNAANAKIAGGVVSLYACLNDAGSIVWMCAYQPKPPRMNNCGSPAMMDVPGYRLPADCRP